MAKLINEQKIFENWAPMLEQETGIKDKNKLMWMSKMAHFHTLNAPKSTIKSNELNEAFNAFTVTGMNTPGMGNVTPASDAAGGAGLFHSSSTTGSGDKFPSLLPLAMQVAKLTIGFDIVNVQPMNGPSGVLTYMDYVYGNGKNPAGAPPFRGSYKKVSSSTAGGYGQGDGNPGVNEPYADSDGAILFEIAVEPSSEFDWDWEVGKTDTVGGVEIAYVGRSFISGKAIFRVLSWGGHNLYEVAGGDFDGVTLGEEISLVSALENHIHGYAGAGPYDEDEWQGDMIDGLIPYEPMRRGVGEENQARIMNLQTFTKFVEAQTYQLGGTVTTEQIQDLSRQYGIDVMGMMEDQLTQDISQSINKHILYRAFALGWENHYMANQVEGVNLNLQLGDSGETQAPAFLGKDNEPRTLSIPGFASYGGVNGAENQDTMHTRIYTNLLAAGNMVAQRGKRGPANFVVCNLQVATALQKNAQYAATPLTNTINQNNGSLYPAGTIAGMTVYVDPNMKWNDRRVLVGRKGEDNEPGLVFMPYLMAESISTITEANMFNKVVVKSRYALVEAGHHPETQYLTFWVDGPVIDTYHASPVSSN